MIVAFPTWIIFLVNGILGIFPAIIFADGGVGQKFHFWLFVKDRLFGGSPDPVWSDAGAMTMQEWLLLSLALPATIGALYCLRRRPEFGSIERDDDVSARESLEIGQVGIGFSGGGDTHTQSIVESVIGQEEVLDQNVVSAALGEMGVIAAANTAAAELEEPEPVAEPILDSRFTTTIQDEETIDMVSAYAEDDEDDEDDTGWSVWEPDVDEADEVEVKEDVGQKPELPEIPEIFREPVSDSPDPLGIPSIPEIPTIDEPKPNITERISTMMTQAADATVDATKEVVSATMTGAKEVASIAAGITEKVVGKVRQKTTKGVMPVRPAGLPPMAEWDAYQGAWTIMGRPVHVAASPEPEVEAPAWSNQTETIPTLTARPLDDEAEPRRNTPFIPELP